MGGFEHGRDWNAPLDNERIRLPMVGLELPRGNERAVFSALLRTAERIVLEADAIQPSSASAPADRGTSGDLQIAHGEMLALPSVEESRVHVHAALVAAAARGRRRAAAPCSRCRSGPVFQRARPSRGT